MGRAGRVHLDADADATLWVGGHAVTCIDGDVEM
jgi:predicted PhzF superfamily epimerase YddE/YHI9